MKKVLIFIINLQCICCFSQSTPTIAWQRLLGASFEEIPSTFYYSNGGAVYLASSSDSNISGDKTENNRGVNYDYWLVKSDGNGSIIWDKTMGAGPIVSLGPDNDIVTSVFETTDGNVLVGGYSNSNISGEKTEVSRGDYDYWLLKLDANGSILWDKTLGGLGMDYPCTFFELSDGNYMVAGTSGSSISGDKTDASRGDDDVWLIKISSAGAIIWQKTIGGNSKDVCGQILQTSDNGFIIACTSLSSISGDKTENSYGLSDYWIVKLDENGVIQWQKTLGGSNLDFASTIIETNDGGYLAGGKSKSPISGLKTEDNRGSYDYWLVKLDSTGVIQWQKTIGGNGEDVLNGVYQCLDNGYVIAGTASSNISGDKTEDSKGGNDGWIVKLNESGVLQWQKDIGGLNNDGFNWVKQLPDESYILGGGSTSSNSFDINAINHNPGYFDIWLLKLNAEGLGTNSYADLQVALYPNPTKNFVTLEFGSIMEDVNVTVNTALGQTITQDTFTGMSTFKIPIIGAPGVYFVEVTDKALKKVVKVVKE